MTLLFENIRFNVIIGILPHERTEPQEIVLYAKIRYGYQENNYLDYLELLEVIKERLMAERYKLLEEAISDLKLALKQRYPSIIEQEITLYKSALSKEGRIGVME